MPFKIIQNKDGSYAVKNIDTGKLKSKHTTLSKAKKQYNLLNFIRFIKQE
jgi:hypothetical protein